MGLKRVLGHFQMEFCIYTSVISVNLLEVLSSF